MTLDGDHALARSPRPVAPPSRYPSLRRASLTLLAGLLPGLVQADTGETAELEGFVSEEGARDALLELLDGLVSDPVDDEGARELWMDGEPWLEALVRSDLTTARDVLLAFEESEGGVDAMVADPAAALEDRFCLLFEPAGACVQAVCGEEIHSIDVEGPPCGILGVFPHGAHQQDDADSLFLYDGAADAFVEFGQRHDMLLGWQVMGCGCAITEGPARNEWYAFLAAVMGLGALIRRRKR